MATGIRTLGDGMDNTVMYNQVSTSSATTSILKPAKLIIDSQITNSILKTIRPVEPKSKVCYLVPKYVPKVRKVPKCLVRMPKEPKFVPYEPYKAAVQPMISKKKVPKPTASPSPEKASKNNIEIQELVDQMTVMREIEMRRDIDDMDSDEEENFKLKLQWEKEKESYETDIKNLRETNAHLENQLKFQAQVNSELKTLLVAAVGEDLESRVQHLTEDKLSLARALLNSANHLTTHQEQTEWLSGQCEVWKSKFLASSLMVEELAKWKSALTNRVKELQETMKHMVYDTRKLHRQVTITGTTLKLITEKLTNELQSKTMIFGNVLQVTNINHDMVNIIANLLHLKEDKSGPVNKGVVFTVAERAAYKLLQNPVSITNKQDLLCDAVMGAAHSVGGKQMFLQHPSIHGCCPHCKGDVQNI